MEWKSKALLAGVGVVVGVALVLRHEHPHTHVDGYEPHDTIPVTGLGSRSTDSGGTFLKLY